MVFIFNNLAHNSARVILIRHVFEVVMLLIFRAIEENSILKERRNVFDNDEFDIFRKKTVDKDKIHRGKKYVS